MPRLFVPETTSHHACGVFATFSRRCTRLAVSLFRSPQPTPTHPSPPSSAAVVTRLRSLYSGLVLMGAHGLQFAATVFPEPCLPFANIFFFLHHCCVPILSFAILRNVSPTVLINSSVIPLISSPLVSLVLFYYCIPLLPTS